MHVYVVEDGARGCGVHVALALCVRCVRMCVIRLQPDPPSDGLGAGDAVPVVVRKHCVTDGGSDAELEHCRGPAGLPGGVHGCGMVSRGRWVWLWSALCDVCVGCDWVCRVVAC